MRYVYASVDPRLRDDPMTLAVARPGRVEISAPTAVLEYDSRDNVFTPTRGIYAETTLLASREAFGAPQARASAPQRSCRERQRHPSLGRARCSSGRVPV